jgi:hypothetical protein
VQLELSLIQNQGDAILIIYLNMFMNFGIICKCSTSSEYFSYRVNYGVNDLYLYVQIFGSDPSCTDYLRSLIEKLFGHTVKLLGSIQVISHFLMFHLEV